MNKLKLKRLALKERIKVWQMVAPYALRIEALPRDGSLTLEVEEYMGEMLVPHPVVIDWLEACTQIATLPVDDFNAKPELHDYIKVNVESDEVDLPFDGRFTVRRLCNRAVDDRQIAMPRSR